jgi:hypothetical protein
MGGACGERRGTEDGAASRGRVGVINGADAVPVRRGRLSPVNVALDVACALVSR